MAGVAGRSGRKPKPTEQKRLMGNPGKRALNKSEPKFSELTHHVEAPTWMEPLAIQMWQMVVPELLAQQVLQLTDLPNVEMYCVAYSRWRAAEQQVVQHGLVVTSAMGSPMKNPAVTIAKEAMAQMVTVGSLLGLDPSSRSRLVSSAAKGKNEFAALLED